jgi:hypothetical protein
MAPALADDMPRLSAITERRGYRAVLSAYRTAQPRIRARITVYSSQYGCVASIVSLFAGKEEREIARLHREGYNTSGNVSVPDGRNLEWRRTTWP